jgi:hypothetical protein
MMLMKVNSFSMQIDSGSTVPSSMPPLYRDTSPSVRNDITISTTQEDRLSSSFNSSYRAPTAGLHVTPSQPIAVHGSSLSLALPAMSVSTCGLSPSTTHIPDSEQHLLPPKPRLDSLFNTQIDIAKFRQLLRESTDETATEERINYCSPLTTSRIEDWLHGVRRARLSAGGLCQRTADDSLESERYLARGKKLKRVANGKVVAPLATADDESDGD